MARPQHKPSWESRRQVSIAAAAGMSQEEIALAIEIDRNTLRKHYHDELTIGACKRRMEILQAAHMSAMKGNVSAQKMLLGMQPEIGIPTAEQDGKIDTKPAKIGKKAQAKQDAVGAEGGTGWDGLLPEGVLPFRQRA